MLMKSKKKIKKILPIASYVISPILGFAILPIITKTINPGDYGLYNYYISLINYLLLFSLFPSINSAILRFLNCDFDDYKMDKVALLKIISYTTILFFVMSLILIIIYKDSLLIYLVFAFYLINITTYYKSYLNINGKKMQFSLLMISVVLSQYLMIFIVYFNFELKTYHLLLGNFIFSIFFIFILLIRKKNVFILYSYKVKKQTYNKIMKFIIPSVGIALSGIILSSSDRIIIKNLLFNGNYYVGIYAINYTFYAQVIDIIVAIFYLYIPSYLYTKYEKNGLEKYIEGLEYVLNLYLIISTLITILVLFNYDRINYILFASTYNVKSKLSIYVLLGQHYFGVYRIISNYYSVINNKKILTYLLGIASIVNIILNLIFIPIFGYVAAAMTTLFCYLLLFVISHIFIVKSTKRDIIKGYNYVLLILPIIIFLFIPNPSMDTHTTKLKALYEIVLNSVIILGLYSIANYKRFKLIFFNKNL